MNEENPGLSSDSWLGILVINAMVWLMLLYIISLSLLTNAPASLTQKISRCDTGVSR